MYFSFLPCVFNDQCIFVYFSFLPCVFCRFMYVMYVDFLYFACIFNDCIFPPTLCALCFLCVMYNDFFYIACNLNDCIFEYFFLPIMCDLCFLCVMSHWVMYVSVKDTSKDLYYDWWRILCSLYGIRAYRVIITCISNQFVILYDTFTYTLKYFCEVINTFHSRLLKREWEYAM